MTMIARFRTLAFLTLVAGMVACNSTAARTTPAGKSTPTPSPLPPSPTAAVSPTAEPNSTPEAVWRPEDIPLCPTEGRLISPPPGFGIEGTIIYQQNNWYGLYAIGGKPLRQGQLPLNATQQASVYGFSPDGQWLAYAPEIPGIEGAVVFGTPVLILLSAIGERIEQNLDVSGLEDVLRASCCPDHEFFDSTGEWINNGLLYIRLAGISNMGRGMVSTLPMVFDPWKGSWVKHWIDDLPEVSRTSLGYVGWNHIKFSPDMSRVLYPSKKGGITLYDLAQGVEVWSDRKYFVMYGEEMAWSPDSSVVAVINNRAFPEERHFWVISRDGEVREIIDAANLAISSLCWSPNSRYLAFTDYSHIENMYLYLYDRQADHYLYRCPLPRVYTELFWSPDGEWIAFGDAMEGSLYLLKVQTGEVIELVENASPVGWSDKFPVVWP